MSKNKRISLKDIAAKIGVSVALVSYVLNGKEKEKRVGAENVRKIREALVTYNYQPNYVAQSLRKGSTKTIGLVVTDIANSFFSNMARLCEDEAKDFGYTIVFGSSDEDCEKSTVLVETLLSRQVDGLIIVPSDNCAENIENLVEKDIPFVLIDRFFPEILTNYVILDNHGATFDATTSLIRKGNKRITMFAYKSSMVHMQERIRGYKDAMTTNNLGEFIMVNEVSYENVQTDTNKALRRSVKGSYKPEALLCATNAISTAALYCIQKLGVKVPDDLAIIGFDGSPAFDFFYSPLSYIEQPVDEMVKEAVRILVEQIKGSKKISHIKLKHKLIERQSSG